MLITLDFHGIIGSNSSSFSGNAHNSGSHGIFCSNFEYLCILTLSSHWYAKGDEASPSIILAGPALLVQMLITLKLHGIFCSNFVYLCILTLSSHWYEKM